MKCPDCGREMVGVTARNPDAAWECIYCEAIWTPVESIEKPKGDEEKS